MSFLTPLFLVGGLALALPVIFHLIRRTTRERTVFSSLMFLLPTPPRLTKRSRLEHWLLLVLRCLALALLALGFARPFLKESATSDGAAGAARKRVILVDTSASMRRAGLWAEAKARVEAVLRSALPGDQVAVFTFAKDSRTLVSFGEWTAAPVDGRRALVSARLDEVSPGWEGTQLGAALIAAAEALGDAEGQKTTGPREIILVSDLQAGSHAEILQGYEWPKGVTLIVEPLTVRQTTNAGLQLLPELTDGDRQAAAGVRVRVTNSADAKREQFKLGWVRAAGEEFVGPPVETYVPPGQSRTVSLPVAGAVGAQAVSLRGDDEDFDNIVFLIPPSPQKISIAYLGAETADDAKQPLFFLRRALPATARLAITVVMPAPGAPLPADAALFVVTNALTAAQATALRGQVSAGKTVLAAPKNAAAAASLAPLLGVAAIPAEEGRPKNYAMLAEIDFQHPLFAAFADPRYSDFTKIHFWKYRRMDFSALPTARMLAKFDGGDPALVEVPVGKGRVVVLASGWNTEDSQLAVSSKFVPLLYALLEHSGAVRVDVGASLVGSSLDLGAHEGAGKLLSASGASVEVAADAVTSAPITAPGIYRLVNERGLVRSFAVNMDPMESRTAPMAADELERLGAPVAHAKPAVGNEAARQVALRGAEAEGQQKLWRWFIIATLLLLLVESLLAGRTMRKGVSAAVPVTP
ncbi:MAG: BatA domain-containing protein [Undibacterium sp.]|nr:BatA domain-containing protein [Opitutaceae bacterium]